MIEHLCPFYTWLHSLLAEALNRADQLGGVGLRLLEAFYRLRAGADQRGSVGEARMEFLLRGAVGGANFAAFRPRGLGGLRRGDPVRSAQDTQGVFEEVFAQTSAAGKPAWRLG